MPSSPGWPTFSCRLKVGQPRGDAQKMRKRKLLRGIDMRDGFAALGLTLTGVGIGFICWPVALITVGLVLLAVAVTPALGGLPSQKGRGRPEGG